MTTSSEDVLLQMGEVRYKKGDGTLYVMSERLAWMAENRDKVAVSHRYADIKMQKISPEGKPKVQLQVVLHDGNSSTFHFVNRNGQEAMLADRDKVKGMLVELLPNFTRKIDKELEEKNRILSENPDLLQLYKDLVITQVISSEEFWATYAQDAMKKAASVKQEIGVASGFLANIKSQPDGCNGLKYNITPDIIHCIFKTYPAVRLKHSENVPHKMSESEFWTKFFQSHYYHRDRIIAGSKDIFTECGKIDEQTLKADVQKGAGDPLLDLRQLDDLVLEEGFGGVAEDRGFVNTGNVVHQNMIKRFNQHSIMVLKTCTDVNSRSTTGTGPLPQSIKTHENATATVTNGKSHVPAIDEETSEKAAKIQRLGEKIIFEDLGQPDFSLQQQQQEDEAAKLAAKSKRQISLVKVERYLHGPIPISNSNDNQTDVMSLEQAHQQLERASESWLQRTQGKSVIRSSLAVNALGELSPGGALMRGFQEQSVGQLVPKEFEKDLRSLYLSLSQLLKHFWNCFPITNSELEEKAKQMHEALQRFKAVKLEPFENRAALELSPLGCSVTKDLYRMLNAANAKYAAWQERSVKNR